MNNENHSSEATGPNRTAVRHVTVDAERAGQRLDNFLLNILKGVPKNCIYRIVRKGEVRVNRGRVSVSYRIKSGDDIRIPPLHIAPRPVHQYDLSSQQYLLDRIVFEAPGFLVINKPSGLPVHGGSGVSGGIIDILRLLRSELRDLTLVHRLDKDTSGCLLIAKKHSALRTLHQSMRSGQIDKRYLTLLQGRTPQEFTVDAALTKNVRQSGERMVKVDNNGKIAVTVFRLQQQYDCASLVEAELITGRTHQIRVHAQHCGHPIAGDPKYGNNAFNRLMQSKGLKRLFLHAHTLRFPDPQTGEQHCISAPLDPNLQKVLDALQPQSA